MAAGIHGYDPAEDPSTKQAYSLVADGTGGSYKIRATTRTSGPKAGLTNTDTATISPTANAATVQTAVRTLPGCSDATVTGGPGASGGGTPYVITLGKGQGSVSLSLTALAVTGGGATATLTQTAFGKQQGKNESVLNPTDAARPNTVHTVATGPDRQYERNASTGPGAAAIDSAVTQKATDNALTSATSSIFGHTKSDTDLPTGFKK